jgi:hypothetical protein
MKDTLRIGKMNIRLSEAIGDYVADVREDVLGLKQLTQPETQLKGVSVLAEVLDDNGTT